MGELISAAELEEAKNRVVAMGAAEKARGPGGGLKAVGVSPPPKAAATGTRTRRSANGSAAAVPQAVITPVTTVASVLTGELRNQIDRIWDAFWTGGIANPLEVLEQLTSLLFICRLDNWKHWKSAAASARASRCVAASSRRVRWSGFSGQAPSFTSEAGHRP